MTDNEKKVSSKSLYDKVIKYTVKAECREPLHIGSVQEERTGILVHPVLDQPFLQATGLAGAFRDFFSYDEDLQKELFGTQEKVFDTEKQEEVSGTKKQSKVSGSRVRFSDGFFDRAAVYTELRPRVRIDRKTGTCQAVQIKGSGISSGQKFEMEYVAAGSVFGFDIYLYEKEKSYQKEIERALSALQSGSIQLGGQKSNGCGYVSLQSVKKSEYDMKDKDDRRMWADETKQANEIQPELVKAAETADNRTHFMLTGKTKGSILVKALCVKDYDQDAPDAENIRNHKQEYIIPASSVKGAIRSRMEKICAYKGMGSEIIDMIFGKNDAGEQKGNLGCVRFYDCVIGDIEENDRMPSQKRIHIDKFTGGVMYSGLFSEKAAYGTIKLEVDITGDGDAKAKGLLLLALRDLAVGIMPLGGGSSIGRGYIDGKALTMKDGAQQMAEIDFINNKITDDEAVIDGYLKALA